MSRRKTDLERAIDKLYELAEYYSLVGYEAENLAERLSYDVESQDKVDALVTRLDGALKKLENFK